MNMFYAMANGGCEARVEELRAEFGAIQAARIIEAEAVDFMWEARVKERYLGQHVDVEIWLDDDDVELARIAVLTLVDGRWYVATCLVDGDGIAIDMLWKRQFGSRAEAEPAILETR